MIKIEDSFFYFRICVGGVTVLNYSLSKDDPLKLTNHGRIGTENQTEKSNFVSLVGHHYQLNIPSILSALGRSVGWSITEDVASGRT